MLNFKTYETIKNKEIEKRVIFDDGINYPISHHEKFGDFFPIPNYFANSSSSFSTNFTKMSFNGRIKDAIDSIKQGYGDTIVVTEIDGLIQENVVCFINREYGEKIREEFLEKWKDLEFEYAIQLGGTFDKNDVVLLKQDGGIVTWRDNYQKDILTFNSEKKARNYIEKIIKKANHIMYQYQNLQFDDQLSFYFRYSDDIFINRLWKKMMEENEIAWYIDILQVIKNK